MLGLLMEMLGALVMAAPDLPILRRGLLATEIEEGGRRLLHRGELDRQDFRFFSVKSIVTQRWDGTLEDRPEAFVFGNHPGRSEPMLCVVYDDDPPEVSDEVSIRTQLAGNEFDWVCDEDTFYDWLSKEVLAAEQRSKLIRGIGALTLALGVALQFAYYLMVLPSFSFLPI